MVDKGDRSAGFTFHFTGRNRRKVDRREPRIGHFSLGPYPFGSRTPRVHFCLNPFSSGFKPIHVPILSCPTEVRRGPQVCLGRSALRCGRE